MLYLYSLLLLSDPTSSTQEPVEQATCFYEREEDSGMYKICYYDCLGSTVAITVKVTKLCPLTIHN